MSLDKVWFSSIDYRPDPSEPDKDRIVLGSLISGRIGPGFLLLITARDQLTEAELQLMDGIGRELLAQPHAHLTSEVERLLQAHSIQDGDLQRALAQRHRWSLHVTPPQQIQIERHLSQTKSDALTTVGTDLLIANMLGREVPLRGRLRAKRLIPPDWRAQLPPAWQLTTRSFSPSTHSP